VPRGQRVPTQRVVAGVHRVWRLDWPWGVGGRL
jgi:hypothetical protein